MKITNPTINLFDNFELFLEGVKVPFASANISENESGFPALKLSFGVGTGALRILPGTIVQLFGPNTTPQGASESVLIYEGEVNSVGYQKTGSSRSVSLSCTNLIVRWGDIEHVSKDVVPFDDLTISEHGMYNFINTETDSGQITSSMYKNSGDIPDNNNTSSESFESIAMLGGVINTIQKLIQSYSEGEDKSDWHSLLQDILTSFEGTDLFFQFLNSSMGLKDSIISFPNMSNLDGMKNALLVKVLKTLGQSARKTSLLYIILTILKEIRYSLLAPASPTSGYSPSGGDSKVPFRCLVAPSQEWSPPALCNVFFSDQVSAFRYDRKYMSEPTRAYTQLTYSFSPKQGETYTDSTIYAVPSVSTVYENLALPASKVQIGPQASTVNENPTLSTSHNIEETYRGIRPHRMKLNGVGIAGLIRNVISDGDDERPTTREDYIGKGSEGVKIIRELSLQSFAKQKFAFRSLTLDAVWNPNRFCGMPAVILDPGEPSIVGVITDIQTSISAQGGAKSTITFKNTVLIYDDDFSGIFSPSSGSEGESSWEKYAINDFSADMAPVSFSGYFDNELYSYFNVGTDIYTYMLFGKISERKKLQDNRGYSKEINETLKTRSAAPDDQFVKTDRYDQSIFSYIRGSKEDNYPLISIKGFEPNDSNESDSLKYSKYLYQSIINLKKLYKKVAGTTASQSFMSRVNYRPIITQGDYLNFIGAQNNYPDSADTDYKQLSTILHDINIHKKAKNTTPDSPDNLFVVTEHGSDDKSSFTVRQVNIKIKNLRRSKKTYEDTIMGIEKTYEDTIMGIGRVIPTLEEENNAKLHASTSLEVISLKSTLQEIQDKIDKWLEAISAFDSKKEGDAKEADPSQVEKTLGENIDKPYSYLRLNHVLEAFIRNSERKSNKINLVR